VQLTGGEFDVIVIGSGRSGRETALAATREGCSTLLISLSPGTIASMMWSTSGKSPLNQELIQAFIPSGHENGNSKEQSTVTIQTSLHQPDRESPVYLLQAQVQQHQHKLPGSDGAFVHVGESRPASFSCAGACGSGKCKFVKSCSAAISTLRNRKSRKRRPLQRAKSGFRLERELPPSINKGTTT